MVTGLLGKRLIRVVERDNLLHHTQLGFRPKLGTNDSIAIVDTILTKCRRRDLNMVTAFLDISKAYNKWTGTSSTKGCRNWEWEGGPDR